MASSVELDQIVDSATSDLDLHIYVQPIYPNTLCKYRVSHVTSGIFIQTGYGEVKNLGIWKITTVELIVSLHSNKYLLMAVTCQLPQSIILTCF